MTRSNSVAMQKPSWAAAKHLLGRYDGGASELFVIDLQASQFHQVITAIAGLAELEVTGDPLRGALSNPESFDSHWPTENREQQPVQHT